MEWREREEIADAEPELELRTEKEIDTVDLLGNVAGKPSGENARVLADAENSRRKIIRSNTRRTHYQ